MGMINSKSKLNNYRFPTISPSALFLSSCQRKTNHIDNHELPNKQRMCMKKKVLILGLDGVGKTDLFNRLICDNKEPLKLDSTPQPTIGKKIFNELENKLFPVFFKVIMLKQ